MSNPPSPARASTPATPTTVDETTRETSTEDHSNMAQPKSELIGIKSQTGPAPDRDDKCTICQEQILPTEETLIHEAHCGSSFHAQCLKEALQRDSKCPLCRNLIQSILTKADREAQWNWYYGKRIFKRKMLGNDQAFFRTPGYLAQQRFYLAWRRANTDRAAARRKANEDLTHTEACIRIGIEEERRIAARLTRKEIRKAGLEDFRRIMKGDDAKQVEAETRGLKASKYRSLEQAEAALNVREEQLREAAMTEVCETLEGIERAYADSIGYHRWVLTQAREQDSRAAEWEDDPPMPA
ncbi:hypothetical protein OHC33_000650 [Knufia fluminis]|uniref:RING-type domain-containing protein n=1 Tax=Knufia fluminis TaxID=191047 RepID=A0AAN8IT42_9EURO|nr:hypothetical protein OHC33_000650 [Knufia fluminis]